MFSNVIHSSVLNIPAKLGSDFASQVPSLQIDCDLQYFPVHIPLPLAPSTWYAQIPLGQWLSGDAMDRRLSWGEHALGPSTPNLFILGVSVSSRELYHPTLQLDNEFEWRRGIHEALMTLVPLTVSLSTILTRSKLWFQTEVLLIRAKWIESKCIQIEQNPLNIVKAHTFWNNQ